MAGYSTIGLLTNQAQNHYVNYGFVPSAESFPGAGVNAYNGACTSRRFFLPVEDNDFFRLTRPTKGGANEAVWYWLGYRVFVEYFDNNVLVDVQWPLERHVVEREDAVKGLAKKLSAIFCVELVGDNGILNVRRKDDGA